MADIILKCENLSKQYRLGTVGTGTLSHDINRWWYKVRGKKDPYLKIGDTNDQRKASESNYVWALKDINFEVQNGEVLGVIGKNGAGKSTLLKILSRVTSPTTGVIRTKGRIASLLEVGTGFHPEMTGRENIFLNGAILGMTKTEIKSKLEEIIEFSGCQKYIDTPVKRYSSGMRVRLAFAVAAFLEPDILVVDEVLAVGDVEFQKKAIGKMQDISSSDGRTVLFVSHNMAAVKNLCTRGIVLESGESIFEGSSEEAVNFYINRQSSLNTDNLLERTDRKGTGEIRFSKVELLNRQGNAVSELISGDYAKFRLHMVFNEKVNHKDLVFGLVIYDNNENKIADFYSDEMGITFHSIDSYVDLELPKLMLRGGSYYVVVVVQTAIRVVKQIDLLHHVLNFNVFSGDYWNVNRANRATNVALIDAKYLNQNTL
ncbi:ABC transporter ATP-binding protein [Winogradskyella sp. DF17]|uniref:ABC transporter ATP-binding protein n=1 Tax=Winogradskyella pelagia TaxID=2819984 RepID=A0ABS3T493_9FLAO|nr:ABC transporter ATP-binding protein [Winogradskyella sp. DF17]MBO3116696.1 ABC transporter ATP-binding protein [Winogradskyella sp. DF17]